MNTTQTIRSNRQLNDSEIAQLLRRYGADPRNTLQSLPMDALKLLLQDAFTVGLNRDVIKTEYAQP